MAEGRDHQRATVQGLRERGARAKEREIDAHARAAILHDDAAATQDRLGHPELAERARQRAAKARADGITALEEQAEAEERTGPAGL